CYLTGKGPTPGRCIRGQNIAARTSCVLSLKFRQNILRRVSGWFARHHSTIRTGRRLFWATKSDGFRSRSISRSHPVFVLNPLDEQYCCAQSHPDEKGIDLALQKRSQPGIITIDQARKKMLETYSLLNPETSTAMTTNCTRMIA